MIVAINYSDKNFTASQKYNTETAYKYGGVDKVIEYSPEDIDREFYLKNESILSNKRGGGYWLWKPYIILHTMDQLNEGDYLIYCDSGAAYIRNVRYLIESLEKVKQDIMPFELPLVEKQWTQRETFKLMECEETNYKETNQILATYILIRVSEKSRKFISEYINFCENKKILIEHDDDEDNVFIEHRHDQSVFSLLCKKYNLETFRDPSQYGIRPWEYLDNGRIYNPQKYDNSCYPQILVSFRKEDGRKYVLKDKIKFIMTKFNILNQKQFMKKNKIIL